MTSFARDIKQVDTAAEPDACVIWLHGLGATADDFVPAVPYLDLPDTDRVRFLFPQAPTRPVTVNGGWEMPAWYDIVRMLPERDIVPEHLQQAAQGLYDLSAAQVEAGIPAERIFWAGFSQGGAVVLEAALNGGRYTQHSGAFKPAAVLALSTYQALPLATPHPELPEFDFWHAHGTQDDVVPFEMGQKAAGVTEEQAAGSDWQAYPMAHEVCISELQAIGHYLHKRLTD